jgi:IS30 family transposase
LNKSHTSINKEIKRGTVVQMSSELIEYKAYKADYAQMKANEAGANKGAGLKIGNDHKLVKFLEKKIRDEKYSPDAALAAARKQGGFKNMICTKTLYTYIDNNLFLGISNKDLIIKKDGKKRYCNKIRKVALNNTKGTSISERPETANNRTEQGHWEIDLVIGKQGTKPAVLTLVEARLKPQLPP